MSEMSRRDVLRRLALTLTATGVLDRVAGQEVHLLAGAVGKRRGLHAEGPVGTRVPRTFERLTDLIIPVENGAPRTLRSQRAMDRSDGQRKRAVETDLHDRAGPGSTRR